MREGIYRKTDAGRDEIRDRGRRLSPPLRTVLLMVDGQRTLAQLREVMAGMKAPADALEALLADGLIEAVPSGFDPAGLMGAIGPRAASRPPSVVLAEAAANAAAPAPVAGSAAAADTGSGAYLYLYERMSEAVRAHLGLRGYFLQLKVERCTDIASLQALLPELRAAVAKAKGESFASDWERTLEVPA
ncbi:MULTISPECIES: hypothetical protein [Pseudoxanthomonas]|uniref:Proline-rich protein n=1 Tax=Pseudoxanthomonas kaohsiungensis TaxID=283923 RepID=A0ABW3LW24_9GAMM|nr:hypothetical protein [Pseudoxanthomonas kaohsiungensis]KAF1703892.1 hypothetical protein CSC66_06360 [Pseudoxanthomonas kaohsiungensis]